jgi:starch-binding outer membrane protein, SusD/RagB family
MKTRITIILLALSAFLLDSCSDFLDFKPKGTLTKAEVSTVGNAEAIVTAAYAAIGNDFWDRSITSMWVYGSVRSDDAYKGGGSVPDQFTINRFEQYNLTTPNENDYLPNTWTQLYAVVSRANLAINVLTALTPAEFPNRDRRIAEMKFLRAHAHFIGKVIFKQIPYIDETLTREQILETSNIQFTSDQLWDKIAADFQAAITGLPNDQGADKGRANALAAKAYLAKVRLYQAYTQNDAHTVTGINAARLNEVLTLTNDVITSGRYSLQPDFGENFLNGFDNGPESIFAIQYSINDGTEIGRLSMSTGLNYSVAPQYGCCYFHIPSQNMVNAFKTDPANGLPMFDTFNDVAIDETQITPTGVPVDPRLDHTVGIAGHPFKYNASVPYSHTWERASAIYGGFGNMKEQQLADCPCFKKIGPFYGSSKNIDIIRYADVLLMRAEALIELNTNLDEARTLINQVRARAAASTTRTRKLDGTPPSNYLVSQYDGVNLTWNQANARKALQWERRLEFAMESPRFFDLVRWGIAAETLNAYLTVEKTRRSFLSAAVFTKGRDEYYPIPQREINFTKGLYKQNPGY